MLFLARLGHVLRRLDLLVVLRFVSDSVPVLRPVFTCEGPSAVSDSVSVLRPVFACEGPSPVSVSVSVFGNTWGKWMRYFPRSDIQVSVSDFHS